MSALSAGGGAEVEDQLALLYAEHLHRRGRGWLLDIEGSGVVQRMVAERRNVCRNIVSVGAKRRWFKLERKQLFKLVRAAF